MFVAYLVLQTPIQNSSTVPALDYEERINCWLQAEATYF